MEVKHSINMVDETLECVFLRYSTNSKVKHSLSQVTGTSVVRMFKCMDIVSGRSFCKL